jgi:hypothetical protein
MGLMWGVAIMAIWRDFIGFVTIAVMALSGALSGPVYARSNPTLTSNENGINEGKAPSEKTSLSIHSLKIDVHVHGRLADVIMNADIKNSSDDTDEGNFSLRLPSDAVVTGYALDVEGKMISGQLLDQPKARNVYEDEIRKGIDPGLAEVTEGNIFQTRVFPITKEKPRSIRVSFSVPFDPELGFDLPLQTFDTVGTFILDIKIDGYKYVPQVQLGKAALPTTKKGATWTASTASKVMRLNGTLSINGGVLASELLISRHQNGKSFFQINDTDSGKVAPTTQISRLRVYWDRSLSRRDDLLEKEIDLLTAYVNAAKPAAIDLVSYASDTPAVVTVANAASLRTALSQIVYRGGTSIADLDDVKLPGADQCMLFSDGSQTLDHEARFRPDCKLNVITSAPEANGVALGRLAQSSQGQFIRLTAANGAEILPKLLSAKIAVVSARDYNGQRLDFRVFPSAQGGWFAVGEMSATGDVRLMISGLKKGLTQIVYAGNDANMIDVDAAGALWASQRAAELSDSPLNHDKMTKLAKSFQVASPTMAFLVLESPRQYLNADIRPPDGFNKEWMAEYREEKKQIDDDKSERKSERLKYVLAQWKERKEWWNTVFIANPKPKPTKRGQNSASDERGMGAADAAGAAAPAPAAPAQMATNESLSSSSEYSDDAENIIVTGSRRDDSYQNVSTALTAITSKDANGKSITLDIADVLSDQPYLKAMDAAAPDKRLQTLAEQEKTFGTLPAFYLETSEWFRLKGDAQTALALLYSSLELSSTNDETRQIVSFRLQRDGEINRAIAMMERIAISSDFRPQPKRSLALALAQRGRSKGKSGVTDLERAFEMLTDVALNPAIRDFEGIETAALMEANSLIPAIEASGGSWSLDSKLVALLDTDVRIVIEWTNDDADIDLWVIEPNTEKVFYGDKTSSAGGTISNDMTDGYGPEEYVIRRAPQGDYQVRINGYDGDRLNPNGNGRVTVRLIRDFARPAQTETLVDAEIAFEKGDDRDGNGGQLIARMKVAGKAK